MRCIIPLKLDNLNKTIERSRTNKYQANNHKRKEMKDIGYFIRKIPPIKKYPIEITFKWHMKNVRADLDNCIEKNILDSMQNLGIIENDNIKHINAIHHYAIVDNKEYVEMEIKEDK